MQTYMISIKTQQVIEVPANSEEDAKKLVSERLKAENPRAVFDLDVVEEIIINK